MYGWSSYFVGGLHGETASLRSLTRADVEDVLNVKMDLFALGELEGPLLCCCCCCQ